MKKRTSFVNTHGLQWLLAAVLVLTAAGEPPVQLLSGPMVGHTTSSTASIWVETDRPADVTVHYWVEAGSQPIVRDAAVGRTAQEAPHTGTIELEGLPDGRTRSSGRIL